MKQVASTTHITTGNLTQILLWKFRSRLLKLALVPKSEVPRKGLASKWQYQMGALMQRAVLTAAALGSALAGAQLTHFVLKPDTRIPEYKPKKE